MRWVCGEAEPKVLNDTSRPENERVYEDFHYFMIEF